MRITFKLRQHAADFDPIGQVEFQDFFGGSSDGCQRLDDCIADFKMILPKMVPRMKQWHKRVGGPIDRCDVGSFESVAVETGPREVVSVRFAIMFLRDDVIRFVAEIRVLFVQQAVFATAIGSLLHFTPQR